MPHPNRKMLCRLIVCVGLIFLASNQVARTQVRTLPRPVLYFVGAEYLQQGGKSIVHYRYNVENFESYPKTFSRRPQAFHPAAPTPMHRAPGLMSTSRTEKRLKGFCALGKPADLNGLWFSLEEDVVPPSWIYIEMTDRQTETEYKSNLAETVL